MQSHSIVNGTPSTLKRPYSSLINDTNTWLCSNEEDNPPPVLLGNDDNPPASSPWSNTTTSKFRKQHESPPPSMAMEGSTLEYKEQRGSDYYKNVAGSHKLESMRYVGPGISPSVVLFVFGSCGIRLDSIESSVSDVIAAGVEFRIRNLIQEALKIANRKPSAALSGTHPVVTRRDIDIACNVLRLSTLGRLGHSVKLRCQDHQSKCTVSPRIISVREFSISGQLGVSQDNQLLPLFPTVRIHWIAINGCVPPIPENQIPLQQPASTGGLVDIKRHDAFLQSSSVDVVRDFDVSSPSKHRDSLVEPGPLRLSVSDKPLWSPSPHHPIPEQESAFSSNRVDLTNVCLIRKCEASLTKEQQLYCNRVRSVIMSAMSLPEYCSDVTQVDEVNALPIVGCGPEVITVKSALERVLNSLASIGGLGPALPFLLGFVVNRIRKHVESGSCHALAVLVKSIVAISSNEHLSLVDYFAQILQGLLIIILSPFVAGRTPTAVRNALLLRKAAAQTLANIVRRFSRVHNMVHPTLRVVEMLSSVLTQNTFPLSTMIGTVLTLRAIGPAAMESALLPVAPNLLECVGLQSEVELSHPSSPNAEIRKFLCDALLDLLLACIRDIFPPDIIGSKTGQDPQTEVQYRFSKFLSTLDSRWHSLILSQMSTTMVDDTCMMT